MARHFRSAPANAYRLVSGAALVAGPHGHGPIKQHEWKKNNPWATAKPDFMINVAGQPVEETHFNRFSNAFHNIGEDNQTDLFLIFEMAGATSNPQAFIRDALYDVESIELAQALTREGMIGSDGYLDHDFEHFVLHRQFPEFFDQRRVQSTATNKPRYTSEAGRAFRTLVINGGKKDLTPDDCTPWAVLRAAGVISVSVQNDVTEEQRFDI